MKTYKTITERIREAAEEGYIQCICGEFVVGVHSSCKSLMTPEEFQRWSERRDAMYDRLFKP